MTDAAAAARAQVLAREVLSATAGWSPGGSPEQERLRREVERSDETAAATVVVVGEKKRGKSSLINALLGRSGLLPVEVDVATSVHIAVRYAERPMARVFDQAHPEGREIPVEDLAEYASVEGNRDPDDPDRLLNEDVMAVEVGIDHPLLRDGMTLVDTPGVGGLEAGHSDITLATLSMADALFFVVDASMPFTEPEVRFLERATERVATVYFVLTKIDKFPGWRTILTDDVALLTAHASRFAGCTWFPVSSIIKADADDALARGGTDAAALLDESGFTPLEEALRTSILGRAVNLRSANAVQAALTGLDVLTAAEQTRLRSATGDPALQAALEAEERRLEGFLSGSARWRTDVGRSFARIDGNLRREFGKRLNEVRRRIEASIAEGDEELLETLPQDLDASLRAAWMDLSGYVQTEATTILAQAEGRFAMEGLTLELVEVPYPEYLGELPPLVRMTPNDASTGDRIFSAVRSAMFFWPLAIWDWVRGGKKVKQQQRIRDQVEARNYLNQVLGQYASLEMPAELQETLRGIHTRVEEMVSDRLTERKQELEATVAEHRRRQQMADAELARERGDAEARLRAIAGWRERAEGLQHELRAQVRASTTPV